MLSSTLTVQPLATIRAPSSSAKRSSSFRGAKIPAAPMKAAVQQHRSASVIVRAEKFDTQEFVKNVSDKWDQTENKGQVITLVAGATAALWVSSSVVGAINYIPLLPKVMELVGLGYSAWFVYRYVLFKDSRKELQETVDELLNKVSDI